ncbi:hypothetical protein BJY01DRAFT_111176 [Aspergillus pseudoustus]|uniref:Transcription factor domain-containing protein n=1 Tax=Aspergillus pseudoustus TaxID=1810923 RepID=A0ABR4IVP8_9EURO
MKTNLDSRAKLASFLTSRAPSQPMDITDEIFPNMVLRPTVFTIYLVVSSRQGELKSQSNWCLGRDEDIYYKSQLDIIMSTILWLSDFFSSLQWANALQSAEGTEDQQHVRIQRLAWLTSTRPSQLIENESELLLHETDRQEVDALWAWFEGHHDNAVRLTVFSRMALCITFR